MNISKKILSSGLALTIITTSFGSLSASAATPISSVEVNTINSHDEHLEFEQFGLGLGKLAVFVGGVLVGWIIDGSVVFVTGQSGDAWVTQALNAFRNGIRGVIRIPPAPSGGGGGGSRVTISF